MEELFFYLDQTKGIYDKSFLVYGESLSVVVYIRKIMQYFFYWH